MAGIAAGLEIGGVSRYLSVPRAAAAVTALVLAGSFHRVEIVLLVLSSVFVTYIASGILAHPRWGQAARGLVVPDLPLRRHAILVATATLGTTLAPWGLAFIQSYAVDKKLKPSDWRFERIDVVAGAVSTGVIGFFVVVACAETLYRSHTHINDASDAAVALTPLAGHLASTLFAVGLVGAGLLAAAILPLSTSYSVSQAFGKEGRIAGNLRTDLPDLHRDDRPRGRDRPHPRRTACPDPLPHASGERGHAAPLTGDDRPPDPRPGADGRTEDRNDQRLRSLGNHRTFHRHRHRARRLHPAAEPLATP